ncbi:MAG: FAD-containing monooxygenase EthA [Gammaproteobacteria bacterium]|nr:MAG: FAD-containing monooxygenase EthA [Gammaproteobacteria bacterium]
MTTEHFDTLIVGAGISGIDAAVHMNQDCPNKTWAILDGRKNLGGTWDLFRYPGIRSDSDMYTLGFPFKPWSDKKFIAPGESILSYLKETAQEFGIDKKIRYEHLVKHASWSTSDAKWTVEVEMGPNKETGHYSCNFLYLCSGYYNYEGGYTPDFPGIDDYKGKLIHPQKWPEDLDYTDKKVTVIGSGATAITLVPALAEKAQKVNMLQRSPAYVIGIPDWDPLTEIVRKLLPSKLGSTINRLKNVWLAVGFFVAARKWPKIARKAIRAHNRQQLGDSCDVDVHFNPNYNPWEERICLAANSDLFKSIKSGKAEMVTDHIETFTETGIKLKSGAELEADIVVTATGLNLVPLGNIQFTIDDQEWLPGTSITYKGMMFRDVPNLALASGYTNASWTLKCDLTSKYVCRLINHMDQQGHDYCTPRNNDPSIKELPFVDFRSGYIQRAIEKFPKQGSKAPWKLYQNYVIDIFSLKYGTLEDDVMEFTTQPTTIKTQQRVAETA